MLPTASARRHDLVSADAAETVQGRRQRVPGHLSLSQLPVRVAAIDLTYLRMGSSGCEFRYDAQIVATAPLYQQLNTADYLHAQAATEMVAIEKASALQRADQGQRTKDQGLGGGTPPGTTEGQRLGGSGAASSPSGGSVDQRLGGSDSAVGAGLSRDGLALLNPDSSHPDSSATPAPLLSPADLEYLSYVRPGAYVRHDGAWLALPTNSAKAVQGVAHKS